MSYFSRVSIHDPADADAGAQVTGDGELKVALEGRIDDYNSSEEPLAGGAVFTGTAVEILNCASVFVSIHSDVASAVDGLEIQQSADGTNWYYCDKFTITAGAGKVFNIPAANRYYRVVYTNGAAAQTVFQLTAVLKKGYAKPSAHRIGDSIVDDDDADLVKAVITGRRDNNSFTNVRFDDSDRMKVVNQEYTYAIAEGRVPGHMPQFKFGTRATVAQATQSTVWEGPTALYPYATAAETLSVVSSSANDTAAGTGVRTLFISGLDANFEEISETVTMNGVTPVNTVNQYMRVNRAYGATCGTGYTNAGNITVTGAGAVVRLYIPAGDGQTLMTLWTVPAGTKAFITQVSASTNSNKGARMSVFTRTNDGGILYPWRIRYRSYLFSGDDVVRFNIPLEIPEKTDIEIRVTTPVGAGDTSMGATFELWYEVA